MFVGFNKSYAYAQSSLAHHQVLKQSVLVIIGIGFCVHVRFLWSTVMFIYFYRLSAISADIRSTSGPDVDACAPYSTA